jgi:hypothetical protein
VKVKFDFTVDDMVDVAEREVTRSPAVRSWRWQDLLVSCLVSALVAYMVVPGSHTQRLFAAVIGALIAVLITPFTAGRSRKRRLQKYFRERFGGDGPYTCEVELAPEGLVSVQAGMRSVREWPSIEAIVETPNSVDFVTRASGSLVVRNRAFRSAEEHDAFVKLARSYAPNSASGP